MTYSIDFWKKVLTIKEREKISFESVSKRLQIGKNTVFVWSKTILC
ncbi:transposase [Orientia tsutsugamushi]|nr:transposase [Orientia tsutsugamushi]